MEDNNNGQSKMCRLSATAQELVRDDDGCENKEQQSWILINHESLLVLIAFPGVS